MHVKKVSHQWSAVGRLFFVFALLVSLSASLFLPSPTFAASPIYVNASAPDDGDGLSWETAYNDLQDAIDEAASGEEIWVAAGAYNPHDPLRPEDPRSASFILKNGVAIYGGFAGTETQLSQRDWTTNVTVLSGLVTPPQPEEQYNVYHVVSGSGLSSITRLDGFTVTGGNANGDPENADLGGAGLKLEYSEMVLKNLIIVDNHATGMGGGMNASFSALQIEDVRFSNNSARVGGGFYSHENDGIVVASTSFDNNTATEQGGGLTDYMSASTFDQIIFQSNIALLGGGGIYANQSAARITDSTFIQNLAGQWDAGGGVLFSGSGGAILIRSSNPVWVQDCIFQGNEATNSGGAVRNETSPSVWYRNTFLQNHAGIYGGAFQNQGAAPWIGNNLFSENWADSMGGALDLTFVSNAVVTNSVFTGNHAIQGGAIRINGPHSSPRLTNLTVANNYVSGGVLKGAGVFQMGGSLEANSTVLNSIIYGNDGAVQVQVSDAQMDLSHSIVADSLVEGFGAILGGAGVITGDPLFTDPDGPDNVPGSADDDFTIPSSSPAVDLGIPGDLDTHDMDADGNTIEPYPFHLGIGPRIADLENAPLSSPSPTPAVDLGAYEAQPPLLQVSLTAEGDEFFENVDIPFTFTVTNNGLGAAHDVVITGALPDNMSLEWLTLTRTMGVAGTLPVLAQGFDLLPGQSASVSFNALVFDGPQDFTNEVQVTAYEVVNPVVGVAGGSVQNVPPDGVTVIPPTETVYEGSLASFIGIFSDNAGGLDAPFTYSWNFDDGSDPVPEDAPGVEHTFRDSGVYNVVLSVQDKDGAWGYSPPTPVTVTNLPPYFVISYYNPPFEGVPFLYTTTFRDAAQELDAPYTYTYTLMTEPPQVIAQGTITGYSSFPNFQAVAEATLGVGSHTIKVEVGDKDGDTFFNLFRLDVANLNPQVTLVSAGPTYDGVSQDFSVDFTDAGQAYGETYTIDWDFGDGTTITAGSADAQHTYQAQGTYTLTVKVTDEHGGVGSDTMTVDVQNAPPVASIISISPNRQEGSVLQFSGTGSDPSPSGSIASYSWDFGDGSTAAGPEVSHTYRDNGSYTVSFTVIDNQGLQTVISQTVEIANVAPVVIVQDDLPDVIKTGQHLQFNGSFTDPGLDDTHTIVWDFGDGTTVEDDLTPTHAYAVEGEYSVTLIVTDDDGGAGSATTSVSVEYYRFYIPITRR